MPFKLKNRKLAFLALIFFIIFCLLGFWQLSRAKFKKTLLKSYAARTLSTPLSASQLAAEKDYRFYRANLIGQFDNQHVFLLDNKTFHGKIGYEVYIPFRAEGFAQPILVDMGFIPMGTFRNQLPTIKPIVGKKSITGMLNFPPAYVSLGKIQESKKIVWPLRIEFIQLPELSNLLNDKLFSYILMIDPKHLDAYSIEWQVTIMSPEKHLAYAVQWFALALTLLILFVVLNWDKK